MVQKDTQFVMKNHKVVQPFIHTDGLELYYDVKGKKNTDNYKSTLLDMSGNGRHGTLSNFAYEGVSGFTGTTEGGLLLDDVDDKIVRPAISGIEYTSASRNLVNTANHNVESAGTKYNYKVIPNTVYTISFLKSRISSTTVVNQQVNVLMSIKIGGTQTMIAPSAKSSTPTLVVGTPASLFATFTVPDGVSNIDIDFGNNNGDSNINTTVSNIQLEKGSTATAYTPYIPLPIMTYQMNGNILSFEKDGTVKRTTKDANGNEMVVSRKGINLIRNGNFANEATGWGRVSSVNTVMDDAICNTGDGTGLNPRFEQKINTGIGSKYYISCRGRVTNSNCTTLTFNYWDNGWRTGHSVSNPIINEWYYFEAVISPVEISTTIFLCHYYATSEIAKGKVLEAKNINMVNLTESYGIGNEPDLAYIQSHPEEFAWTPNPNDLIETVEIKNNLVGDLENLQGNDFEQHEDGVITYTNEAEEGSVVRVDIDGISDQPLRFRNATGEQVVITEHDQIDEDAIKKVEFQGNSVQLADKYREVSGTSVTIAPEFHDKNVVDKLVIGGNTTQYTESSNVVTDGLEMWLSGRNFSNSPATTVWKDLNGVNNGTASGFVYTSVSGSDGAGGIVFDGVDDGVIGLPSQTIYDYSSFTLEVKCIIDSTSVATSVILGNRYREGEPSSFFKLNANMFEYYVDYVQHGIVNTVNRNTLVHLTIVKDRNTLKYFTNGELTSSKTLPVGLTMPPMPFGIGKDPFSTSSPEPFKGKINFVRKYGRALSDAEVLQNYNAGVAIPIPNIAMPQEVKHVGVLNGTTGKYETELYSGIGNRNLILNSEKILLNQSDYGNTGNSSIVGDYVSIITANNGNVYNTSAVSTSSKRIKGETYTLSFDIATSKILGMYFYPSESYVKDAYIPNTGNTWQRITFTYTQTGMDTSSNNLFGLFNLTAGVEVKFRRLKLEIGNVATPWIPAPEDIGYGTIVNSLQKTKIEIPVTLKSIG